MLEEGILKRRGQDMMAVLDAVDDGGQLAAHPAVQGVPKISRSCRRSAATGRARSAFEELWMGKLRVKDG